MTTLTTEKTMLPVAFGLGNEVAAVIGPAIADMGFNLVRVAFQAREKRQALVIMVEGETGRSVTVGECEKISRTVAALLDVADIITDRYFLEVSSAGIDRPLVRRRDFESALGFEVKVKMSQAQEGRLNFRGALKRVDDAALTVTVDGAEVNLPLSAIAKAKLVLTDTLIKATANH